MGIGLPARDRIWKQDCARVGARQAKILDEERAGPVVGARLDLTQDRSAYPSPVGASLR